MRWIYSLRTRLIVLYTGLILLGFGSLAFWAGQQIETAAEEDFEHRTESEVAIVARALTEPVEDYLEGHTNQDAVAQILNNYAEQTNSELALINSQGIAWLSTFEKPVNPTYLSLPEVVTARENRITHETRQDNQGDWMIYTAAPIIEEGRVISVVQLIVPLKNVETSIQQRWVTLGMGVAGLGVIVLLVSILISASVTRPLARLRRAAIQIAQGDFSAHVPDKRRDEIGQVAQTFNVMAGQVQAMLEDQRAFASNVSHELRTPITAVQLRIEALLSDGLDATRHRRYLEEVQSEINRMNNLVDDLILLSRLDAGSVEIGRDKVDMPRFARQLIREMQPLAEAKNIALSIVTEDGLPPVSGNLTHLHVVFRNILDNAIKYMDTDRGQIHWRVFLDGNQVTSVIRDTGRGIVPDELDAVMKRFYRADKARSRTIQGAGLGLPLVKSVVDAYNGEFSMASAGLGKGTTVQVSWPIEHSTTSNKAGIAR